MHFDTAKLEEFVVQQFPVAAIILIACGLCWWQLRNSFRSHLAAKDKEIERMEELLKDAQKKRDDALQELHKYLKKPGSVK